MSEEQGKYEVEDNTENAMEMLGKGYERPSVVVEPPHRRTERRGKHMIEVEEPAYVKFSTDFKTELADLDVYSLKVFIYIGLSINFESGTAYPGVRKIAADTRMNKDTVAKAIEELEGKGFLQVWRKDGASNTYKPTRYFAIGETVPRGRTPAKLSDGNAKLSDGNAKLSDASRVKSAQQDKQDKQYSPPTAQKYPTFSQKVLDNRQKLLMLKERISAEINVDPNLKDKKWVAALQEILKREEKGQTFAIYAKWFRAGNDYNRPKPHQIGMNPNLIINTWGQAFVAIAAKANNPEPEYMADLRRRAEKQSV
jgi:hypothetical protein